MLTIEQEPPRQSTCGCCGGVTTTLVRYVYKDGDAHAAYLAAFADNHPDHAVSVLIGLGGWGEDSAPADRRAFGLRIWLSGDQFQVEVVDAVDLGWSEPSVLGSGLSREAALADPDIGEIFHISDHIVVDDGEIVAYFQRVAESS